MKKIIKTLQELQDTLSSVDCSVLSLDTETDSLDYYSQNLLGISLYNGVDAFYIDTPSTESLHYLNQYMKDHTYIVIMHNSVFDIKVLRKYGLDLLVIPAIVDTMILDHLVDENRSHGLKDLAKLLLGKTDVITWEESHKYGVHSKEFADYAMNDVIYTWELYNFLMPIIERENLLSLYKNIEMRYIKVLVEMEELGVLVNKELVDNTTRELQIELERLELEMLKMLNEPYQMQFDLMGGMKIVSNINFNSSAHLSDILFNRLGFKSVGQTETGKEKTGKEVIDELKGQHPFIDLLYNYKVNQKLLNAFFKPLPEHVNGDGRVRPRYNDTGTATGRLSCQNPNLQQLPKSKEDSKVNVRKCFIAPPGKKLITCDYSGQELRILAEVTQDQNLIDAFNSGRDFHSETAKQFGVSRSQAKAINFGIAYGKGAYGFSKDFKITEDEAQKILDNYFNSFPKVKQSMFQTKRELDKTDKVTNLFGRHRRFQKVGGNGQFWHVKKSLRQAFNFKIQGSAADMIRLASIATYNLSKAYPEWGLKQIATVHDENIYECKEEYVDIATKGILDCFANVVSFKVPMISEIGVGDSYAEAK